MGDVVNVSWCDILRTEGVTCKGFGVMPKYPMLDRDLSLTAKTIYAYLCSLSGNGDTAYPGVDTIIAHLGLNKETYYTHFKKLTAQGYISVQKQTGPKSRFAHNLYCIESNPKKFIEEQQSQADEGTLYGSLSFSGLKAYGFGLIPRAVMIDERISTKAKGLYAYFASYTGAGKVAFPKQEAILYHLNLSKTSYYKYQKELIQTNYIKVVQRYVDGRRGVNDFFLVDKPDESAVTIGPEEVEQRPNFPDTVKQDIIKQDAVKQDTVKQPMVKQDTVKQDAVNPDTTINSSTRNILTKTTLAKINPINQQPLQPPEPPLGEMDGMDFPDEESLLRKQKETRYQMVLRTYYSRSREDLKQDLLDNLELDSSSPALWQIEPLIEIILDYVCSDGDTIKISGETLNKYEVAQVLFDLSVEHFEYVLNSVDSVKTHIKNLKAYYLKCLYEAPKTYDLYAMRLRTELDQLTGAQ